VTIKLIEEIELEIPEPEPVVHHTNVVETRHIPGGHLPGEGETFANNLRTAFDNADPNVDGYCTT
jgi:hypothetical protein